MRLIADVVPRIVTLRDEHVRPDLDGREDHSGSRQALDGLRIAIVDDNALHRTILANALRMNGAAAVGGAWDMHSLGLVFEAVQPQIVLLTVETRHAMTMLRTATALSPGAKVIVVGLPDDDETHIVECAEAGVVGYHTRRESFADLLILIRRVAAGMMSFSPAFATTLLHRLAAMASQRRTATRELVLTDREAQILRMLEGGLSNHDIAVELSIAVHTVKNHVHNLLKKLGVSSRADAAALSRANRRRLE
ncbi:response regulator transcription factor [Mycobacterium yunnanensis]|uniref:Response regulator transcription factor n=1 Tax=Mycobacterium yunnanensis TaxID=368477 RepID=A0A9X2YWI5_9MYCO|nr:response regulator transcription factor [Mycobacterium yunnanensis]MCV7418944.1 response regulator transcription factor [Mycobacterium yunnanensis]